VESATIQPLLRERDAAHLCGLPWLEVIDIRGRSTVYRGGEYSARSADDRIDSNSSACETKLIRWASAQQKVEPTIEFIGDARSYDRDWSPHGRSSEVG
jgi:hypothetical protein